MMKAFSLTLGLMAVGGIAKASVPFAIEVVDAETGRGVPLIELRTVNEIRLVTDSAGVAAFDEPGLMGRRVFFHVRGPGYAHPEDGFGFRGKAVDVVAGGRARLAVRRLNVAQRLYRATGAGIYRDSVLVGRVPPIRAPLLNAQVLGSDSVLEAVFRGKVHWFWGDTNRPGYPLGNFQTPTATSRLPADGGLDPDIGVDYDYAIGPEGFAAASAPLPGEGPTWLDGLTVLADRTGAERMFAAYAKIRPPMDAYRRGLVEFDPETRRFAEVAPIPMDAPLRPFGHPFRHVDGGVDFVYFADPYPLVRVRADVEDLRHLDRYEAFTCLLPGSRPGQPAIDRTPDGSARYAWRRGAPPLDAQEQARLVGSGAIRAADALFHLRDADTGRPVVAHRGSTYRNAHRDRWVMIATEIGGQSSHLGEVWFAEADTPLGPWTYARKVVTHDRYSFYNPKQHPTFAKDGGRTLFFEGTYTISFSGNPEPTPRYDYNQVVYKLDLADPRLNLPVPIYEVEGRFVPNAPGHRVAFYALDQPGPGTVPLGAFHILPPETKDAPATTTMLYRIDGKGNSPAYLPEEARPTLGPVRTVGRAWTNPMGWDLPAR